MKKIFSFAAICALLVACNGNKGDEPVVDFPQGNNAGKASFALESQPFVNGNKISSIDHYGNGSYKGVGYASAPLQTKGVAEKTFIGRFTVTGDVYSYTGDLKGGSMVKQPGGVVSFTGTDGNKSNGNFSGFTIPSDPSSAILCGAHWKLSSIKATLKGKNVSLNFNDKSGINPNDVEKVAEEINAKGGEIPMDKVSGYYIKAISLNVSPDVVIVEFTNKPSIEGTWKPVNKTFTYSLNADLDGKLFDADAAGTFDFEDNNNTLVLTMNAKASSSLEGTITIKAKRIQ